MLELIKESHATHSIGIHFVWCTKYRHSVLVNGVDVTVKQTIGEACGAYDWKLNTVEVMPDHVHVFLQINHTDTPCDVAKTLKSLTAVAVFYAYPKLKGNKFWGSGLWSRGTYYGSVGSVSQEAVMHYISNQKSRG